VKFTYDSNENQIKIKGEKVGVLSAVDTIKELIKTISIQKIDLSDEDFRFLCRTGDEPMHKLLESTFDVVIMSNAEHHQITVIGVPEKVSSVEFAVKRFLDGDINFGSYSRSFPSLLLPQLLGKGGANVKRLEEEFAVRFDVGRDSGKVRVRGDSNSLKNVAKLLSSFIRTSKVTERIDLASAADKFTELKRKTQDLFKVEIEQNNELSLRGLFPAVSAAKSFVSSFKTGYFRTEINLASSLLQSIQNRRDLIWSKFRKFVVSAVESNLSGLCMTCPFDDVARATVQVLDILISLYPQNFVYFSCPVPILIQLLSSDFFDEAEQNSVTVGFSFVAGVIWFSSESLTDLSLARDRFHLELEGWNQSNLILDIEEFVIPSLLGKAGASINQLKSKLQCEIDIDRTNLHLHLKSVKAEMLDVVRNEVSALVDGLHSCRWEVEVDERIVSFLLNKQGEILNKLRNDTKVQCSLDKKKLTLKVSSTFYQIRNLFTALFSQSTLLTDVC
jgi:rRNA processing protein Krr1/Pno1